MGAVLAAHERGARIAVATSGTTGPPGEVVRTTRSWWDSFAAYADLAGVRTGSSVWLPGPLSSTMNLFAAVHARTAGARLVADPAEADRAVLTPARLARDLPRLTSGTRVVVAGAALPPALADRAERGGVAVCHYYGAAELSFVAAGRDAETLGAFPGVELDVRDGAIWVRSAYVADTGPALRTCRGWSGVGDLGTLADGRLTVTGRPDAVTTAGATVRLAEVEAALLPVVAGPLACLGVPRESVGTLLVAAVTSAHDRDAARTAARRLPAAHRPRGWLVLDELPLTEAGKVDQDALRAAWLERHPGGAR